MRSTAPALVCALALLSAPSSEAADATTVSSGGNAIHVQPAGWSKDEQRVALRVYSWLNGTYEAHDPEGVEPCAGYVDHRGKPLRGGLEVQVFEGAQQKAIMTLLDEYECTPPKEAEELRTEAKERLAGLDIDTRRTGSVFVLKPRGMRLEVKAGRRAPYSLEYVNATRTDRDKQEGVSRFHGTLRLYLRKGSERRKLFEKELDARFSPDQGSAYAVELSHVFVSPSGERLVVLAHERVGNPRGVDERTWVAAVVDLARGEQP